MDVPRIVRTHVTTADLDPPSDLLQGQPMVAAVRWS